MAAKAGARQSGQQVTEQQQLVTLGLLLVRRRAVTAVEGQQLLVIEHQQFNPRIIMQEQRGKPVFEVAQRRGAHAGLAHHRDTQLKSARCTGGDAQLCRPQASQCMAGVLATIMGEHQLETVDAFDTAGGDYQALYQQLQGRLLGL
ncbi:hypothetical protein D3C85_1158630 [compost metagenome]